MAGHILVFDLGTTYFKVSLFSSTGRLVALRRERTPITSHAPGYAEISPTVFQSLLTREVQNLSDEIGGLDDVSAITYATQANTFLLVDRDNSPLTPFIVWSDERAAGTCNPLVDFSSLPSSVSTTGIPKASHLCMPAKLRWLQENSAVIYSRAHKLMFIGDYLTWWLTGNFVTEAGAAALTGLVDINNIRWWKPAIDCLGLSQEWLPKVVRAGIDIGGIRPSLASAMGLPADCRFVVGCLDQYAGAIGSGNVSHDRISETTGTVLATVSSSEGFRGDLPPEVYQGPSYTPNLYYQMLFSDMGAGLLERYREGCSPVPTYEQLNHSAQHFTWRVEAKLQPDALRYIGAEMFLPQYQAEVQGHHVRAIMNAVAMELKRQVSILVGSNLPEVVRSVGGAARSELWRKIKAKQLGTRVVQVDCPEPTSLGAAVLARHAQTGIPVKQIADDWVCLRS